MTVSGEGFLQGINFVSNTVTKGDGDFYFSGNTTNQAAFGNDGLGLNFYDAGPPSGGNFFDTQNTNPHFSVTKNVLLPRSATFVPNTCSDIIKKDYCAQPGNKPNAGTDITICTSATTKTLANLVGTTKRWTTLTGPATFAITRQTANASGLTSFGDYLFILTDTINSAKCSDTITVSKIKPPTVAAGSDLKACASGSPGPITLSGASFGGSASTAAWSVAGTGLSSTALTNSPSTVTYTPAANFSGTITLTLSSNVPTNCTVATDTRNIVISPRPTAVITGDQTICNGSTTSNISIALTGSQPWSLTYSDGSTPVSVTGITSSPFTFTVSPTSTKTYNVTALNDANCSATTADLTGGAVITVDPTSVGGAVTTSKNVCSGVNSGTLTLNGQTGTIVRWESSTNGFVAITNIANTTNSLNYSNISATTQYRAVVKSGTCPSANSNSATLTVDPTSVGGSIATSTNVCSGVNSGTLTLSGNTGNVVQWQFSTNGFTSSSTLSNTTSSQGYSNIATTTQYRAVVKSGTCANTNSGIATLTVDPTSVGGTVSASSSTICSSTSTTVTVTGHTGSIQWQQSPNGSTGWVNVTGGSGATSATYTTPNLTVDTYYRAVITSGTCSAVNSTNNVKITVNTLPSSASAVTASPSPICAGGISTVSIANSQTNVKYRIYDNLILRDSVMGNTGSTVSKGVSFPLTGLRTITVKATIPGCSTVTLTDQPTVQVNAGSDNTLIVTIDKPVICVGDVVKVTVKASQIGVVYNLEDGGSVIKGPIVGTGADIIFTVSGLSVGNHALVPTAFTAACGTVNLSQANVKVNPDPNSTNPAFTDPTVCSNNANTSINLSNLIVGVKYVFSLGGVKIDSVTATASTAILVIPISKLNPVANTVTIRSLDVVGSIAACTNASFSDKAVVTINPDLLPGYSTFSNPIVCSNAATASVTINNSIAGVKYVFSLGGVKLDSVTASGTTASLAIAISKLNPIANVVTVRTLDVSGSISNCATTVFTDKSVVTINPNILAGLPAFTDPTVCSNAVSATVNLSNTIAGVKYVFSLGGVKIDSITATGTSESLAIALTKLSPLPNAVTTRTLDVTGSITNCTSVLFNDKAVITINPDLIVGLPVFSDPTVCSNVANATINLSNTISGVKYIFLLSGVKIDSVTASGTTASLVIPLSKLNPVTNTVTVRTLDVTGSITNCTSVIFTDKAVVTINPDLIPGLPAFTDPVVCSNVGSTTVNITNSIAGVKYVFSLGGVKLDSVTATGTTASLSIALSKLNPIANTVTIRSLDITGSIANCTSVLFSDKAVITINPDLLPGLPTFSDPTVCSNVATATINLSNTISGVKYVFSLGGTKIDSVTAIGTTSSISIQVSKLNPVANIVTTRSLDVTGSVTNCSTVLFNDKAVFTINPQLLAAYPAFTDPTVCSSTGSTIVNITNAISGVKYIFSLSGVKIDSVTATSTTASLIIQLSKLNPVPNTVTVRSLDITGSIANCNSVLFNDKSVITINPLPLSTVTTVGDTICSTDVNADITITNAQANVTYEVYTSGAVLATGSRITNGPLIISLPRAGNLNTGDNAVNIRAIFLPCSQVGLSPVNVRVNPLPSATSSILAAPPVVCQGGLTTVSIGTSTAGATYRIYDNGVLTDSILSTGGNITKQVNMNTVGARIITVKAYIQGCGVVDLTNKDTVTVLNGNNINIPVTATDTVCTGNPVTVTVQNTELLVDYQVFENTTSLSTVKPGTGGTITYTVNGLAVGSHILKITATTVCGPVDLKAKPIVIVNGVPTASLAVKGDTLCLPSSADSMVTIFAAQTGVTYKAFVAGQLAGQGKGTGANLKFAINRSKLSVGNNYIKFTATNTGCTVVNLKDSANMRVNTPPNLGLKVISDTVCSIPATNPVLKIVNAQDQVKYKAYFGIDSVGVANGPAASLPISINVVKLLLGDNSIKFTATINGCGLFNLTTTANARINTPPKVNLAVTNDTVCTIGGKAPVLIIKTAEKGVVYKAYKGAVLLGSGVGTNADLLLTINKALLASGDNPIRIEAELAPCIILPFPVNANVRVNNQPSNASNVTANPTVLCVGQKAKVTISNTTLNAKYIVYDNADSVGAVIAKGASASVDVSMNVKGDRIIKVKAIIGGCDTVLITKTAPVRVNDGADINLNVVYDSVICFGGSSKVIIQKTELNTVYEVFENTTSLSSKITGTGKDTSFIISGLGIGSHTLTIQTTIGGCGNADLVKKPFIRVDGSPNVGLTVIGDTLCNPSTADSSVTIKASQVGVTYTAFVNTTTQVGQGVGNGSDLKFKINRALLVNGNNQIDFMAKNQGCVAVKLNKSANMRVNLPPNINLSVLGDTVCSQPVTNPVVKVLSAEDQVKYTAFLNTVLVGFGTGPQSSLGISIDNTKLAPGNNTIRFVATINGCPVADLLKTVNARINTPANVSAVISNDTICTLGGANPIILVKNSELNVIYRALKNGVEAGKGKGTGLDLPIKIDKTFLSPGDNPIVVEMTSFKCASGFVNRNIRVNTIPDAKLTVKDTTVCTNSPMSHVGIEGTTSGITYSAYENGILKGNPKLSKGGRLNIPINIGNGINELKASQNIHNLIVKAFIPGCDTILEGDTAIIKINQLPSDSLTITGSSGCGDAKVSVANTTAGVFYQALKGNAPVNTPVKSNGGLLVLSIPSANLGIGTHIINVTATIDGCAIVNLKDTASVTVKEVPSGTLKVTGSTVCTNSPNATVTVEGTKPGEVYQAYVNNIAVGDSVKSTTPNILLTLPVNKLAEGNNIINVRSRLPGCGETTLLDTGLVIINKRPDSTRTVSGSTVCSNSASGQIYIDNSKATEVYNVYEGSVAKGIAKAGNGGRLEIDIPIGTAANALDNKIEDHFLSVIALIPGCDTVKISQKGLVKISQQPDSNLIVTGSVGCGGTGDLTVTVSGTRKNEIYQAYLDTVKVGSPVTSSGGNVILSLPVNSLKVGKNIISVSSFITGCANVKLKDTALVVVNTDLANDLTVIGDTVCSDSKTAFLTILQTKAGEKYIFELKGQSARPDTLSSGGSFKVPIPVSALSVGLNSLVLKSQNPGCGVALLTNPGLILVNGKPDDGLGLDGDIVCSNGTNAQVTIANTKKGETYFAYSKGALLDSVLSSGNGIVFNIPVSSLVVGINKINAKVFIKGCGTLDLKDTAQVLVNPLPSDTLSVTGDTVCIGNKIVSVTIEGTRFNERYQAYENGKLVGGEKISAGGKLILNLPLGGSTGLGEGYHKIEIKSTIDSCTVVDLKDWADVLINTSPDSNLTVIGDIVCSNGDSATVQILGTRKGEIYKAELNGLFVSQAVTSSGGTVTLRIPVNALSPDTNLVNIFAKVVGAGCPDITLDNQAKVVLNGLPTASLKVSGDTVCSSGNQAFAKVKIFNTTKSVTYTAYSDGIMLGQPIISTGDTVVISIPIDQLKPDLNIVNFIASIDSCANVNLTDSAFVIKNQLPTITSDVEGSIVCSNELNGTVTIKNSALNAVYVAKSGGSQIGSPFVGTGNDITILLPVNKLTPDTNIVSIDVSIKGCGTQALEKKAMVIVNPKPSADLNTEGDVVCETSPVANVKIELTQRNVSYQAYYKGQKIGSPMVSNGNTVNLSIPVPGLSDIENKISVKASINKCEDVDLKDTALVVVNKVPKAGSVKISGSSICPGDDGEITMSGGDLNVVYNILVNGATTPFTFKGNSPPTTITIPASYLPKYTNDVTLRANIPSCEPKDIGDGASIYVLSKRLKITGRTLLCDSSISDYQTDTILGALSYKWTVTDDAKIISPIDTVSSVKVRFGTQSPLISVVPMATKRTCPLAGDTIKVNIEPFVRGNGFISSKDTVCLNAIDSVYAGGLTGVSSYKWVWSDSIDVLGITKRTRKDSIQYVEPGIVTLKAIAYSNCAVAYVDTIIKHVLVLSTPHVEANEYDIIPMKGSANIINLNGSGTSVTSGRDTISYKWYTDKLTPGQIINPKSLFDATLIPTGSKTKVYLVASNIKGYCPAKDSAIINLTFKLEIPNVFTPNGDGVHDAWEIKNINIFFSNCTVEVFNKWGNFVYRSAEGYPEPWDGTRNGEDMPVATYYYIVDLKDGDKPHTGSVTIIR